MMLPGSRARRKNVTFLYENSVLRADFFGASAMLFGVIALMWHDPDTWQP
jgi:hypothetical protein